MSNKCQIRREVVWVPCGTKVYEITTEEGVSMKTTGKTMEEVRKKFHRSMPRSKIRRIRLVE